MINVPEKNIIAFIIVAQTLTETIKTGKVYL